MNTSGCQARRVEYIGIAAAMTTFLSPLKAFTGGPPGVRLSHSLSGLFSASGRTQKEVLDKHGSNIVKSVWLMSPPAAAPIFRKAMIAHDKGKPAAR
ncbi:MAG TPA: hypothetical protein VE713_12325 [Pyrinomonadaceae bacterium]|nr:hypothetical protein [Pyrinomonadaceae bacterium]